MIEINLVPAKIQKAKGAQQWYYLLGGGAVVVFAVLGFLYITAQRDAARISREIEEIKVEQEKLRPILVKIDRIRSEEQLRNDKLAAMKTLIERQVFWIRVAQDLADSLPANAYLTSVRSIGTAGKLTALTLEISGAASSKASLANVIANLSGKPTFSTIELLRAEESGGAGYTLVRFMINAKVALAG